MHKESMQAVERKQRAEIRAVKEVNYVESDDENDLDFEEDKRQLKYNWTCDLDAALVRELSDGFFWTALQKKFPVDKNGKKASIWTLRNRFKTIEERKPELLRDFDYAKAHANTEKQRACINKKKKEASVSSPCTSKSNKVRCSPDAAHAKKKKTKTREVTDLVASAQAPPLTPVCDHSSMIVYDVDMISREEFAEELSKFDDAREAADASFHALKAQNILLTRSLVRTRERLKALEKKRNDHLENKYADRLAAYQVETARIYEQLAHAYTQLSKTKVAPSDSFPSASNDLKSSTKKRRGADTFLITPDDDDDIYDDERDRRRVELLHQYSDADFFDCVEKDDSPPPLALPCTKRLKSPSGLRYRS